MKRRGLVALALLVVCAAAVEARDKIVRAGADKIENEYIVVLEDDVLPEQVPELARQLASAHGARVEKTWRYAIKAFFVTMPEARAEALSRNPNVKYVEENARWYLSADHATNVNPISCDPTVSNCPTVVDNRLWHLDRADQNLAAPTNRYRYSTDGTNVTVYVVDSGVNKFHQEFGGRVQSGYNATGDGMPADDPCMGFALPAVHFYEQNLFFNEVLGSGHGTSVASALGGRRAGIAKNVTIVPVKSSAATAGPLASASTATSISSSRRCTARRTAARARARSIARTTPAFPLRSIRATGRQPRRHISRKSTAASSGK